MAVNTLRIRGAEASLQLVVDGVVQEGSFAKTENFSLTPRADLVESNFIGETESDLDEQVHGYDFSFGTNHAGKDVFQYVLNQHNRDRQHLAPSAVNIIVIYRFRDGTPPETLVLQNCVLKLDQHSIGGRSEYVKNTFSGKCKRVSSV